MKVYITETVFVRFGRLEPITDPDEQRCAYEAELDDETTVALAPGD
jgi:hypothetical protein